MKADLDKSAISNPMIVDPPSTSKPPSKPKPKSVSNPPNDNDTDKEARKVTKIIHNQWKKAVMLSQPWINTSRSVGAIYLAIFVHKSQIHPQHQLT
jgi:hypothetical protein